MTVKRESGKPPRIVPADAKAPFVTCLTALLEGEAGGRQPAGAEAKREYSPHWHPPYEKPRLMVIGPCPIGRNSWLEPGTRLRNWFQDHSNELVGWLGIALTFVAFTLLQGLLY